MFELIIKSIRNNVSKSVIDFGLSSIILFVWFGWLGSRPLLFPFEVIIEFISNNVSKFVIEFGLGSIFLWFAFCMVKPSRFFLFVKPETKWKRWKAVGVLFAAVTILSVFTGIVCPELKGYITKDVLLDSSKIPSLTRMVNYIFFIDSCWLLLAIINPCLFFFASPDTKWIRLKVVGVFLAVFWVAVIISVLFVCTEISLP